MAPLNKFLVPYKRGLPVTIDVVQWENGFMILSLKCTQKRQESFDEICSYDNNNNETFEFGSVVCTKEFF